MNKKYYVLLGAAAVSFLLYDTLKTVVGFSSIDAQIQKAFGQ